MAWFPFRHEVVMEAEVEDQGLRITTTVRADEDPVPVSFGFHPYLRLPAGQRERWVMELPAGERLALDDRSIPTGGREPLGPASLALEQTAWDDGMLLAELPTRFAAHHEGRGVAVELLEGFPYGQIYAPPDQDFVCFEPMTAPTNALRSASGLRVLEPGQEHRTVFAVRFWSPD